MSASDADTSALGRVAYSSAEAVAGVRYQLSGDPVTGVRDREAYWYFGFKFRGIALPGVMRLAAMLYGKLLPGSFPQVLARVHHFDQRIVRALREDGVKQVCLLGAGFDNRALRLSDELDERDALMFEVDMAPIQARKKAVLRKNMPDNELPARVRYVTCDFNREGVDEQLTSAGWRADVPSFYACEGVVYYLTVDSVESTLRALGNVSAPGSRLSFDYPYAGVIRGESDKYPGLVQAMKYLKRSTGETFRFDALEPGEDSLRAFVEARGLEFVEYWNRDKMLESYEQWLVPAQKRWGTLPAGFAMAELRFP